MRDEQLCDLLATLNDDVLGIIWSKLPPEFTMWKDRSIYIENHALVKNLIPVHLYDSYLRDILRNDCAFVLEQILKEQFDKFHKWKKYVYRQVCYPTYLVYLRTYARDCVQESGRSSSCLEVIDRIAQEKGFSPNWYKHRNVIVRSQWSL